MLRKYVKKLAILIICISIIILFYVIANFKMKIYIANKVAENIEITDKIETTINKKETEDILNEYTENIFKTINISNNNIIGFLTIPDILLENAPIKEDTTLEILEQSIGHFTSTNVFEGNVGLASHNSGGRGDYFKNLKNINIGSKIYYKTQYGTKIYIVITKEKIDETNFNYLEQTDENRITLITCVKGEKEKRLCVQAIENKI